MDVDFLPVVGAFANSLATCYGIAEQGREGFQVALVQLVKLIFDRAFSPGDEATLRVTVIPVAGGLEIVIHDRGLPFDAEKWTAGEAAEILQLVHQNFDQVRFLNLGQEGHQTRLLKYFQRLLLEADVGGALAVPKSDGSLEIRHLAAGEALQVSRCVYRCYGYSYGALDAVYYPERLEALSANHEIISMVAVTEGGEVAGHLALEREPNCPKLATAGVAAVLPQFRSRGLAQKLTVATLEEAARLGVEEVLAFAVTSHPYSQKLAHGFGFHAMAIYLATAYFNFKGIREGEEHQRETLVGLYRRLTGTAEKAAPVYAPTRHRAMIESLCSHLQISVEYLEPHEGETSFHDEEEAEVRVRESPRRNLAKMHIARFGKNWQEQVRGHVRYLRQREYRQFILSLPLNTPHACVATRVLEKLGFFFSGLMMREEGLCLVLQYLHGVTMDYGKIQVVEPMARELLSYVRVLDPGRI